MQPLKENFFVKTSYAYFNLFKKLYFIVLLYILAEASAGIGGQNAPWACNPSVDFYNLFNNHSQLFRPNAVPIGISLFILFSNIFVFFITFHIINNLEKFLRNIYEENPFVQSNGKYIKTVGTAVIALSVFFIIKTALINMILVSLSTWTQVLLFITLILSIFFSPYFIIGLFIYTLGEIIIRGSKLKEELDLTV